eukprot:scpid96814/ scgid5539/ Nuclear respiratory factor 1; Not really finished protein
MPILYYHLLPELRCSSSCLQLRIFFIRTMASLGKTKKANDAKLKRLWEAVASKMKQINDLGCHGGAMATIKGKILAAGSLGSSMLEHRHLLSEKAVEGTLPLSAPIFTPLPAKLEDMPEKVLRSWVADYVRTSVGRNQPRWGNKECAPVWWPHHILPYANVCADARIDKAERPYRQCLELCLQACCEHHGIIMNTGCSKAQ